MKAKQMKELLHLLEENSQIKPETMATMMNVPVEEIIATIAQLEDDKVILKYPALINWAKIEENANVRAMIDVKVTPQRDVGFDEIAARIYKFPEVQSVHLMSGTYDLSVVLEGGNINDVAFFVAQKLATLDHVVSTATHFILKTYKHDGVIFDEPRNDRRMIVAP